MFMSQLSRATLVYTSVCEDVLQLSEDYSASATSLSTGLPYLRHLLMCCACSRLLQDAVLSPVCGHCYCYKCREEEPKLKILCRECKLMDNLIPDQCMRSLVECYKVLCYEVDIRRSNNNNNNNNNINNNNNNNNNNNSMLDNASQDGSSPAAAVVTINALISEVKDNIGLMGNILDIKIPEKFDFTKGKYKFSK